jgi:nitrogen-specific signal transduction histidine kinase
LVRGKAVVRAPGGRATRVVGTMADISERRLLEDQLRQAQKLEAVGQLAGGIAHDFNNILASMTLQLDLMELETSRRHPSMEGLHEVRKAAQRAAGLTRQLLMFSRRTVPQMRPLDLNVVVSDLLKMLSRLIGENVELRLNTAADLPNIEADAGMVEQVLMNLVVNARDAMPKGGRLTISTDVIELGLGENGSAANAGGCSVRLIVEDTGCGMSEEVKKHLYEPFFTTKEVGRGTGLGLATIHGIVTQHHGRIEVESTVGQGTRFIVYWPAIAAASPAPLDGRPKGELPRGSETILLVEDEEAVRRNISRCLKQLGYAVLEAANGQEALAVYPGKKIDLLFTDMLMPEGVNGAELAAMLRQKQPDLRVVISSGYLSMHNDIPVSGGGIVYLQKPYEHHELAGTVRCCLDA